MLTFDRKAYDAVVAHAREGAPEEVCGVLVGPRVESDAMKDDHTSVRVDAAHRVPNVADHSRTEYRLDPERQLAIHDRTEADGRAVVGFYHSHPDGPPRPSATDEARAAWPGYVYVVVSLGGERAEVGAWRWTGEAFEREPVEVTERDT